MKAYRYNDESEDYPRDRVIGVKSAQEEAMSRRRFLAGLSALAIGGALAIDGNNSSDSLAFSEVDPTIDQPSTTAEQTTTTVEQYIIPEGERYADNNVNTIVSKLKIRPADYFRTDVFVPDERSNFESLLEINKQGNWINDDKLLPIFAPNIYTYKDIFIKYADMYDIPVNFLAAISTIESNGNKDASSKSAHGIIQIVPKYHRKKFEDIDPNDDINSETTDAEMIEVFKIVDHNIRISAQLFAGDELGLKKAKKEYSDLHGPTEDQYHISHFGRAAVMYNGGGTTVNKWDSMESETRTYTMKLYRFIRDAEIAATLRKDFGYTDSQIIIALNSNPTLNALNDLMLDERFDFPWQDGSSYSVAEKSFDAIRLIAEENNQDLTFVALKNHHSTTPKGLAPTPAYKNFINHRPTLESELNEQGVNVWLNMDEINL